MIRRAVPADVPAITATLVGAFQADPVWGWVFPDPQTRPVLHADLWRIFVEGALPHGWVWTTAASEAATVWLPPGAPELSGAGAAELGELFARPGARPPADVDQLMQAFERAHPPDPPHYYLSIVGTHRDHRGRGLGAGLLAHDLALIDAEGAPCYLESSNPANVGLYRRLGFDVREEIRPVSDGPGFTTMWRPPGGPAGLP